MDEEYDKREHSAKREVDDLTNYQKLNSLDGAGVAESPEEIPPANATNDDDDPAITHKPVGGVSGKVYDGDYDDGIDFSVVDDKGKTNT
jgi:hypothetical protein